MTERLGENIQREWNSEPFPSELWEALQLRKTDRVAGLEMLAALAERGSTLAMMYLGHAYVSGDDPDKFAPGEAWLNRSADGGSVEGRFQLAIHYKRQGNGARAVSELKTLADQGYAPAMYFLGAMYHRGEVIEQDIPQALKYLNQAKGAGHLPARGLLSWIYRKEGFGLSGQLASHWHCLAKIPSFIWYMMQYPNSDRLRGIKLPTASS